MAESGPEEVVRQYLEAESRFESTAHLTTGRFRTIVSVIDQVNSAVGAVSNRTAVNVRSLTVRQEDAQRAVVDLDAFVVIDYKSAHGGSTTDFRYRGPVEVLHDVQGWKIASVVVDGVPVPGAVYDPELVQQLAGCDVTMFALPTKKGVNVFAKAVNATDDAVTISELRLATPYLRVLEFRWGSVMIPARVEAHESWAGVVGWSPLALRKPIRASVSIGGESLEAVLLPVLRTPGSLRARLWRVDRTLLALKLIAVLGVAAAALGNFSLLGITFAVWGATSIGRAAVIELAHFRSSGSIFLGCTGVALLVAGSGMLLSSGFGWIGLAIVVGTMFFAMQRGFQMARYVHRQRSRQVETG